MKKGVIGMCAFNFRKSSFALGLLLSAGASAAAQAPQGIVFEPHNKATATVTVTLSEAAGQTEFDYRVHNATYSARPIISFHVQIDLPISSITASGPATWDAFSCCIKDVHRRSASGSVAGGWLYGDTPAMIAPGSTLGGFKIRSPGVIGIKKFFIESNSSTTVPKAEPGNEEEARQLEELTDFFNDSTSGWTLGPEPMPTVFDPVARITRLVALKHQAADLGWLGGTKLVEKLDQRLDQASAALIEGNKCVAHARLDQFIHRLNNAHSKPSLAPGNPRFATDEAFLLLKSNAESITTQLPKTPKDRAEERECKKVAGEKDDDE